MKNIFYLLAILFLSLLLACSEEPPTNVKIESLSKKPVPPPPPAPLPELAQNTKYIAGNVGKEIFIWDCNNLSRLWSRSIDAFSIGGFGIGDFIGDGYKQLLVERRIITGQGRYKIEKEELLIFKRDDTVPQVVLLRIHNGYADGVWDMKIGNIDDDPELEIVIVFRDQIEIWEYTTEEGFDKKDSSYYFSTSDGPSRADLGDFNGDNVNEIIVAFQRNWYVYNYDGNLLTEFIESSAFNESGNLDCAKMSDVDGNGTVEVIGGYYPNKVLLWNQPYTNIVYSPEFSSAPWAIGIGELDGDLSNGKEILAGLLNGGIYLLHYEQGSLNNIVLVVDCVGVAMDGIIVADIDNNNSLEIVVATNNGLQVYDSQYYPKFIDNIGYMDRIICQ